MSTFSFFLGCNMAALLIGLVLYVLFGQITVRKLRKNPKLKYELGMEFASGWDILNVAQALATPRKIHKFLENSQIGFLHANSDLIRQNTGKFDRILAVIFFWTFMSSGFSLVILCLLDAIGLFGG